MAKCLRTLDMSSNNLKLLPRLIKDMAFLDELSFRK